MRTLKAAAWLISGVSLVLLFCASCNGRSQDSGSDSRRNVLLVTLDTVRADRLGAYGYKAASTPHIDRLASEGIRFADATTQSPLTGPAHAALLTGIYPTRFGLKINAGTPLPASAVTLAEILGSAGYRTGAFIGSFVLDRQYGFAQGFDLFDAEFRNYRNETKQRAQRTADEIVAPALEWMRAPSDAPFFAWVHLYDAHTPYAAPPPFGTRFSSRPYDGEIAYVDDAVGRVRRELEASSLLERTIVVAVGDHGEALGEHGEEEHGVFLYEPVLHIPWIVRLPAAERAGTVIAEQVRAIDLTPTVVALAGVRSEQRFDGESLAGVMQGRARAEVPGAYADAHYGQLHFGWSMLRSWRHGNWKYIDAPRPELYAVHDDRAEQHNRLDSRANLAGRLSRELHALWDSFGPAADTRPPQPDAQTMARLRSLGYVGSASSISPPGRGADPKDRIKDMELFRQLLRGAVDDVRARQSGAAVAKLKQAIAVNGRAYDVHVLLRDAWRLEGEHAKAIGEYEAAALLNPVIAAPHLLAAEAHLERGAVADALACIDRAAKLEPSSSEAASLKGRAHERAGQPEDAIAAYRQALTINPSDTPTRARLAGVAMTLRRYDLAEPELARLLERNYQPARTRYALGYIAESRGDRAAAAEEYRRALELEPSLRQAREALARVTGSRRDQVGSG